MKVSELLALRPASSEAFLAWNRRRPNEGGRGLFGSATLGRTLGLLTLHPGRPFSMAQVLYALAGNYESTHRALHRLVSAGVVERSKSGRELAFTMPREHPLLAPLRAIALHSSTIGPRLRWAQEDLGRTALEAAFVFGSMAALTDDPTSDVDLFIVGDASLSDVHSYLGGLGDELDREVNPVCRSRRHIQQRFGEGHAFYRSVWVGARIIVLGTDELIAGVVDEHADAA